MAEGRARLCASVLDAHPGYLSRDVRRALKAGADRIHWDVMDAHFVPNLSFGPTTIKRLRKITKSPYDAHLMISEPSKYVERFIDAGCDSITIHVEVDEPIEPTLRYIRDRQRAAGLALKPGTPLTALEPYRNLIDIVMVMTVEPGFGGQSFDKEAAKKIGPARNLFRDRTFGGEIHVDGGVNRESAELCGSYGVDFLVVGSTLWKKGHDIGREIRLIKALADDGYQWQLNNGVRPPSRDRWTSFASLPKAIGKRLAAQIEHDGIPVIQLRDDGQMNPDGVRNYELLIPLAAEEAAVSRFAEARQKAETDAEAWRQRLLEEQAAAQTSAAIDAPDLDAETLDQAGDGGDGQGQGDR